MARKQDEEALRDRLRELDLLHDLTIALAQAIHLDEAGAMRVKAWYGLSSACGAGR